MPYDLLDPTDNLTVMQESDSFKSELVSDFRMDSGSKKNKKFFGNCFKTKITDRI
jgi:hypothetical protein